MKEKQMKIKKEKRIVHEMIALYCRKKHRTKKGLCPSCQSLETYAYHRSDVCPFMQTKSFCSNCKVHCYRSDIRLQMKEVMRFSGPRMLLYHPLMAMHHLVSSFIEKKKEK